MHVARVTAQTDSVDQLTTICSAGIRPGTAAAVALIAAALCGRAGGRRGNAASSQGAPMPSHWQNAHPLPVERLASWLAGYHSKKPSFSRSAFRAALPASVIARPGYRGAPAPPWARSNNAHRFASGDASATTPPARPARRLAPTHPSTRPSVQLTTVLAAEAQLHDRLASVGASAVLGAIVQDVDQRAALPLQGPGGGDITRLERRDEVVVDAAHVVVRRPYGASGPRCQCPQQDLIPPRQDVVRPVCEGEAVGQDVPAGRGAEEGTGKRVAGGHGSTCCTGTGSGAGSRGRPPGSIPQPLTAPLSPQRPAPSLHPRHWHPPPALASTPGAGIHPRRWDWHLLTGRSRCT